MAGDDVTLGEVHRLLQDLRGDFRDLRNGFVPREVYEIDRSNTAARLRYLDLQLEQGDRQRLEERRETRNMRVAILAAVISLVGALLAAVLVVTLT